MSYKTKKLTMLAMLAAVAYVVMLAAKPLPPMFLPFLSYDPKDIALAIGGMLFGPLAGVGTSVLVCVIQFLTSNDTGLWGLLMDIVSSVSFVFSSAIIYKHQRKLSGAALGLGTAVIFSTAVMLLWNYIIVPLYTAGIKREDIAGLLFSAFLPFNLIKSAVNASAVMVLYKPLVTGLRSLNLMPPSKTPQKRMMLSVTIAIVSLLIIALCIILMFINRITAA